MKTKNENIRQIVVRIDKNLALQTKITAMKKGMTFSNFVECAIKEKMDRELKEEQVIQKVV